MWCNSQSAANLIAGLKRFPIRRPKPIPLVLLVTPQGPLTLEVEQALNTRSTANMVREIAEPAGR